MSKFLWALSLVSCKPPSKGTSPEEAETVWIQDIAVAAAEAVPTTLAVSFTTTTAGPAWVEYSIEGGPWQQTPPSDEETEHTIPVIAGSLVDVELRIVASLEGASRESGVFAAQSGGLLPGTPTIEITINNYTPPENTSLLMSVFGEVSHVVMADFDGTVSWALPQGSLDENLRGGLSVEQSVLRPGELIFNTFNPDDFEGADAEIWRVNLLGEPLERLSTPGAHHFVTQTPDGDLLWMRVDARKQGKVTIIGDEVIRHNLASGESAPFFNTWDTLELPRNLPPGTYFDWTHLNWMTYSPARDSYLLSTAYANTLIELDTDGDVLRLINGFDVPDLGYEYDDIQDAFAYPHGVHWAQDDTSLLVFSTRDRVSHAARYTIDEEAQSLSLVWEYGREKGQESVVLGEVQELSDGNYLVSWGGLGILQIVTPYQEVLWEARTALGSFFSQTHLITDPYGSPP